MVSCKTTIKGLQGRAQAMNIAAEDQVLQG